MYIWMYIYIHMFSISVCSKGLEVDSPEAVNTPTQNLISNTIPYSKESEPLREMLEYKVIR